MPETHRRPAAGAGRRAADLPSSWWHIPVNELRAIVAAVLTLAIITGTTWLTLQGALQGTAAVAIYSSILGYAWGAYNVDKITDRRGGNGA